MKDVVVRQRERVDGPERRFLPVDLRHGDRAVERDDGARRERQQVIVQLDDLAPVGAWDGGRLAVHCLDGGLELVRPRLVPSQAPRRWAGPRR